MVICKPEVRKVARCPEKDCFIILACDGIWDCLNNEEGVHVFNQIMK